MELKITQSKKRLGGLFEKKTEQYLVRIQAQYTAEERTNLDGRYAWDHIVYPLEFRNAPGPKPFGPLTYERPTDTRLPRPQNVHSDSFIGLQSAEYLGSPRTVSGYGPRVVYGFTYRNLLDHTLVATDATSADLLEQLFQWLCRKDLGEDDSEKRPPISLAPPPQPIYESPPELEPEPPFEIPFEDRGEHVAIVAAPGYGKTQLVLHLIAKDLQLDDPPGLIVIDPTGATTRAIQHLAIFNDKLRDRILIIDPAMEPAPGLNMFEVPDMKRLSLRQRQAIENDIVGLFTYVFASTSTSLTPLMGGPFSFVVRLLVNIPGATLYTLKELIEDRPPTKEGYSAAKFKDRIEALDYANNRALVDFFRTEFYTSAMDGLRTSVASRINAIFSNPLLQEMFCSQGRIDWFGELNKGSVILVNTNEELLGSENALVGRYVLRRCLNAAFQRASIPFHERKQVFAFVDEAPVYWDDSFETILNRARQFKLGLTLAFQNFHQAPEKLQATIASSTAVKISGGINASDARLLSNEMRSDIDFLRSISRDPTRPRPKWADFAVYVRNLTPTAVRWTVPFYDIEKMPQMSDQAHADLLLRNSAHVAAPAVQIVPPARSLDIPLPEQPPEPSIIDVAPPPLRQTTVPIAAPIMQPVPLPAIPAPAKAPPPPQPSRDAGDAAEDTYA